MLAFEMGLGKTFTALSVASRALDESLITRILVIAPSSLSSNWHDSAEVAGIQVTTWSFDARAAPPVSSHTLVIIDESHYLKNKEGGRWKRLRRAIMKTTFRLLLTGTPMPNRPNELWTQLRLLGLDMSWIDYTKKFCAGRHRYVFIRRGFQKKIWDTTGSSDAPGLRRLTLRLGVIYENKFDVLPDLPEMERRVEWVKRGKKKKSSKSSVVQYATDMVQRRIECTALWERLLELVKGTWRTMIFAKHRLTLDKACAVLRDAGIEHMRIDGDTNPSSRQFLIDGASSMRHPIICSVGAAGTGLNATEYHEMIFLECSWSGGERLQCEARVHRMGQRNNCTITYLFVKNSVDEKLWGSLTSKNKRITNLHHADRGSRIPDQREPENPRIQEPENTDPWIPDQREPENPRTRIADRGETNANGSHADRGETNTNHT